MKKVIFIMALCIANLGIFGIANAYESWNSMGYSDSSGIAIWVSQPVIDTFVNVSGDSMWGQLRLQDGMIVEGGDTFVSVDGTGADTTEMYDNGTYSYLKAQNSIKIASDLDIFLEPTGNDIHAAGNVGISRGDTLFIYDSTDSMWLTITDGDTTYFGTDNNFRFGGNAYFDGVLTADTIYVGKFVSTENCSIGESTVDTTWITSLTYMTGDVVHLYGYKTWWISLNDSDSTSVYADDNATATMADDTLRWYSNIPWLIGNDVSLSQDLVFNLSNPDIGIVDNTAEALDILSGAQVFMRFQTTNSAESLFIQMTTDFSGYSVIGIDTAIIARVVGWCDSASWATNSIDLLNESDTSIWMDSSSATGYWSIALGYNDTASGLRSTVSGGRVNVASDSVATVSGGANNRASGVASVVSGGSDNTASGKLSFVSGGKLNVAGGIWSGVLGGIGNNTTANNNIVIGMMNVVGANADTSVVIGYGASWDIPRTIWIGGMDSIYLDDKVVATGDGSFGGVLVVTDSVICTGAYTGIARDVDTLGTQIAAGLANRTTDTEFASVTDDTTNWNATETSWATDSTELKAWTAIVSFPHADTAKVTETVFQVVGKMIATEFVGPLTGLADSATLALDIDASCVDWDELSSAVQDSITVDRTDSVDVNGWNYFNTEVELTNLLDDNYQPLCTPLTQLCSLVDSFTFVDADSTIVAWKYGLPDTIMDWGQ